jgi:hypothetical protein
VSGAEVLWGIAVIGAGVFISVYGNLLFRFALAAMGFGVGFLATMRLLDGQEQTTRVLLAFAIGGILAILLYSLVKFTVYIAGGVLGLVAGFVLLGVIDIFTSTPGGWFQTIVAVGGAAGGAFLGNRIANSAVLLATAAAGAFLMVNGLHVLFASQFANDAAEPASNVATKFSLVIFVLLFAVGGLGQWNAQRFRQRILR